MTAPIRVQLRRAKGWRMPPNTVKVDRSSKWGNPCVVGVHGTREECVRWFELALINGYIVLGQKRDADGTYLAETLIAYRKMARRNIRFLRGRNLACWCRLPAPGQPDVCHAATLIQFANR